MENSTKLSKVVYGVLLTQIQFGAYRRGDKLPTIEETGARLHVSVATARDAYLKLKEEGYITLSKNVGATVIINYSDRETEEFIQTFFALRKNAMLDLDSSLQPLLGNARWIGLKHASEHTLQGMEDLLRQEGTSAPWAMLEYLEQTYGAFGNRLLMRLVWQSFMFLYAPFFSLGENLRCFDRFADYLPEVTALCRRQDWPGLRAAADRSMDRLSAALGRFCTSRITSLPPEEEIAFPWSSYQKSRQRCYSFAMELLISISRGAYPAGSLLPSQTELAEQRGVSVSTVRRALELLRGIGAIKSARYVGTRVIPLDKTTENSDFSKPVLQRRLLDMVESIQIFALSCKEVSLLTLTRLDAGAIGELCGELKEQKLLRRGDVLSYFLLGRLAKHAPYQAIRTVYTELLRQFFWAYALRGMEGSQEEINARYDPHIDGLIGALEEEDFVRFSARLEELMIYELRTTVGMLSQLRIPGAENMLLPDESGS